MSNNENIFNYEHKSLIDYFNIIKDKIYWIVGIFVLVVLISTIYALSRVDIYTSSATLKIDAPNKNILESPFTAQGGGGQDRFIANQIETMKNITIRKKVTQVILDTFKVRASKDHFSLILEKKGYFNREKGQLIQDNSISNLLGEVVKIEQTKGLDFIQITTSSPSPYEAALIANAYANVYREFNLADTRKQVTRVKEFLADQKNSKYQELINAENRYKLYQLKEGSVQLDEQASSLISTMTDLESKIDETSIEKKIVKETLDHLKKELNNRDKSFAKYLESKAAEPHIIDLQREIATLETQKSFAQISTKNNKKNNTAIEELDNKISALKNNLELSSQSYKTSLGSSSAEDITDIAKRIFEHELQYNSLTEKHNELLKYFTKYEKRFEELPEATIDLARIERERIASEKLYLLLEEKYQEALINEQSTEGNVLVLNYAEIPGGPSAPNRSRIILTGLILGLVLGIGFALVLNKLDKSVKTPEDIENNNIELLGWIPEITEFGPEPHKELIVMKHSDTISTDAFKSLRTTLRYSKVAGDAKSILVTSSAPSEGKTLVSANLAGSYALAKNKTVIVDCDLRKPRLHNLFNEKRTPGFTDYLVGSVEFEELMRPTPVSDLYIITAGTIPPNPTEILDSKGMKSFLKKLSDNFDTVILDSPPLTTLADSLILSNLVDETILVARAYSTEMDLLKKSVSVLKKLDKPTFGGVLLNGFNLTKNYGSYYYKYAYSYSHNGSSNGKAKRKRKKEKVI